MRQAGKLKFITLDTKHYRLYRDIGFMAVYNSYPSSKLTPSCSTGNELPASLFFSPLLSFPED